MEYLPSDKVQLRTASELQPPSVCAMCGNATCLDGYVDPSVWYEWEGQVYFCMNCALQISTRIGCLPPDQHDYLKKQLEEAAEKIRTLQEQLNEYQYLDAGLKRLASDVFTGAHHKLDFASEQKSEGKHADVDRSSERAADGSTVSKKPVAGRGPNDVKRSAVRNSAATSFSI